MTQSPSAPVRQIKHPIVRDLIAIARERLSQEAGRPRLTILRRAASDAYYAVFHALCYLAADATIGWSADWTLFERVYRLLDHNSTAQRLKYGELVKMRVPSATAAEFQMCVPDLQRLGVILQSLKDLRTAADYDPQPFKKSKSEIAFHIDEAAAAVDLIEALPPNVYQILAVHLIARSR